MAKGEVHVGPEDIVTDTGQEKDEDRREDYAGQQQESHAFSGGK